MGTNIANKLQITIFFQCDLSDFRYYDQMKGDDSVRHLIVNAHLEIRQSTQR